jgi:5-methylcytosine-specific restriction endonuclease McrA
LLVQFQCILNRSMASYQTDEPCAACGTTSYQRTYHHEKTRGSGGRDDHWNLFALDKNCHTIRHQVGIIKFVKQFPVYEKALLDKGWYFCEVSKRYKHPNG